MLETANISQLVLCCFIAAVTARPADTKPEPVKLTLYDNDNPGGDKGFSTFYEQSDGTSVHSKGELVKVVKDGKDVQALVITGSYSFYIDDVKYTVKYTADENGYHPQIIEGTEAPPGSAPGINPLIVASLLGAHG